MGKAPLKPGDLQLQNLKYLRFVDPEDTEAIIQLALVDTGSVTGDGIPIHAPRVDTGEFEAKTIISMFQASVAPASTGVGTAKELKNNKGIAVSARCDFNASATAGALIWLEASPDGINWDSLTDKFVIGLEPTFAAGATVQRTTLVDSLPKFIRVKAQNLDAAYGLPFYIDKVGVE